MNWPLAAALGVAGGVVYTLSPWTVLFALGLVPLWRWLMRGLSDRERRWVGTVFAVAVALRLAAIAGLFLTVDDARPYGIFFGDEELFKQRTLWLRNIGLGIPISRADMIYAFDEVGRSGYLFLLAYLQALFGPMPYGVHLMNALLYLVAAVWMYRLARAAFGGIAAIGGLTLMLFLPSLFFWSISALKEPLYILAAVAQLACVLWIARAPRVWQRAVAALGVCAGAYLLQSLRFGGLALAGAGTVGGLALTYLVRRPRLIMTLAAALPLVTFITFNRPEVQERVWPAVHMVAGQHWGHVHTPGFTYQLMEPNRYLTKVGPTQLTPEEAVRYVVNALVSYVLVPLPWNIESRPMLAFLPEQMLWYLLFALVPFGLIAGWRRDPLLTSVLFAHAAILALMVALTGGNVGTLIRHRGLVLPYIAWISVLGGLDVVRRLAGVERWRHMTLRYPFETRAGHG